MGHGIKPGDRVVVVAETPKLHQLWTGKVVPCRITRTGEVFTVDEIDSHNDLIGKSKGINRKVRAEDVEPVRLDVDKLRIEVEDEAQPGLEQRIAGLEGAVARLITEVTGQSAAKGDWFRRLPGDYLRGR